MNRFMTFLLAILCLYGLFIINEANAQKTKQVVLDENIFDVVVTMVTGENASLEVRWYPSDSFTKFLIEYKELASGESRKLIVTGDNFARLEGMDPLKQYSVSVSAINEVDEVVGYSPEEIWHGKRTRMLADLNAQAKPAQPAITPTLETTLKSLDSNNFPFIYTAVAVDTGSKPVAGLTKADFTAFEDGRLQTDFFDVTPPDSGGSVRILDFIFVIDNSGSMQEEHEQVKNNVKAFVDSLSARQIDVRLGLVRFGQTAGGGQPIIMNNGNMTGDIILFNTLLQQMTHEGGVEPGIEAIFQAATTFSFRPGSQRHFLLITDEDSDGGNLAQTINTCNSNNITVHAAVDTTMGSSKTDYSGPNSIRGATKGLLFNVIGPYSEILPIIIDPIGNTYIVRYRTDNPLCNGQQRAVRILVNAFGQSDDAIGTYLPCAAPIIQRTQATIELSKSAKVAGSSLTIAAKITDPVTPFVQSATLYYRTTGTSIYVSIIMSYTGNDIYEAIIPGSAVITPGVDYYITATDGDVTSSDPTVDPNSFPYQIAVLPNQPPEINHTPVSTGIPGQDILIAAGIVDNTNFLNTVDLHYRKFGTLLFTKISMSDVGGDQHEGRIPGTIMTNDGVEYFIRAVDDFGLSAIHGVHLISDTSGCVSSFSDDFEDGSADGWNPLNSTRWEVTMDRGDLSYFLNTTEFLSPDGKRLGEYTLISGQNWNDFDLTCQARVNDDVNIYDFADFAIVFGHQDDSHYYYLMINHKPGQSGIYKIKDNEERLKIGDFGQTIIPDNNYHEVRIKRNGTSIEAYYNQTFLGTVNDSEYSSGAIGVGSFNDSAFFDDVVVITSQDCQLATITIPSGLKVPAGHKLKVPIIVNTQKSIGLAQFTIEYDKNDIQFDSANIGSNISGFSISQLKQNPPFPATTPGTNQNLTVQISGGGTNYFTGENRTVVVLDFTAIGSVGDTTPLAFDTDCSHTFLTTNDFKDICGDQIPFSNGDATIITASGINGHVLYYTGSKPVKDATLILTGAVQTNQITDHNGFYQFSNIAPGNYTLVPSKNDDLLGAIKGSDALLLMRYLAFLDTLSNDQIIAADVTQNGTITGSDVVGILRFLAFDTTNVGDTGNWHFIPQTVSLNVSTTITQDFKALVIGDIIGDWGETIFTNQLAKFNTNEGTLILDQVSPANSELVQVPVLIQTNQKPIHTIIYSIAYDTSEVQLKTVVRETTLKDFSVVVNSKEPGKLHVAAVGVEPILGEQTIFGLTFEINKRQKKVNQGYFIPLTFSRVEINDHPVQWIDGGIEVTSSAVIDIPSDFELLQNYPNPFNLGTSLRFGIPATNTGVSHIILDIYNINGQRVRRLLDIEKSPGYYSVQWDGRDENDQIVSTGIYFYTLKSETVKLSKKLLLIK